MYRIKGVEDHLHIVTHLHPSVSLANLVKTIKIASSGFIKDNGILKTSMPGRRDMAHLLIRLKKNELIEYVKNQEDHHKIFTFREEYIELLNEHEIEFDEKYLW